MVVSIDDHDEKRSLTAPNCFQLARITLSNPLLAGPLDQGKRFDGAGAKTATPQETTDKTVGLRILTE